MAAGISGTSVRKKGACITLAIVPAVWTGIKSWWVWLTPELTVDWEVYDDLERQKMEVNDIQQMLENHRGEITGLFDVVYQLWGIEYLSET